MRTFLFSEKPASIARVVVGSNLYDFSIFGTKSFLLAKPKISKLQSNPNNSLVFIFIVGFCKFVVSF